MSEFQSEAAGHLSSHSSETLPTGHGAQAYRDEITTPIVIAAVVDSCECGVGEDGELEREATYNIPQQNAFELPLENDSLSFVCGGSGHGIAVDSELQLPSEHMQYVGQSLPSLATELVTAQSSQVNEVQRRKALLTKLHTTVNKEKDHLSSIERDIFSTAKDICLSQDECSGYIQDCVSLKRNIGQLIKGKQDIEFKLKRAREEFERESKVFSTYREKISKHIAGTEEVENSLPSHMELASLKRTIQYLKDQRCEYMQGEGLLVLSGKKQCSLQEQSDNVLASVATFEEEKNELEKWVNTCKDHNQQMRRELDMKRKRHNAQVTRLQRQVSEAKSRRKQWEKEADQLRMSITQLRQRIEE